MGGAENVVLALHTAFPDAPIYTALYDENKMAAFRELDIRPSRLQKVPTSLRRMHKLFPTLAVGAMRSLDLGEFDIIIASTYLHGHQITKSRPDQLLIAYCHTPPRYYWSHYDEYRRDPGFGKLNPVIRMLMPLMVPRQRRLDVAAARQVDVYLANSTETQARIRRYYDRTSTVIHPPVDTHRFKHAATSNGDYYVTSGRQLPYKRHDLAIAAATRLGKRLLVFGDGPAHDQLVSMAGPTVEFRTDRFGDASDAELEKALGSARGFIFAAEEDFGIVTVEAIAAGAPVIGLARGGTTDIITDGHTGVLFPEQTIDSVVRAIERFESLSFNPIELSNTAKRFDKALFIQKMKKVVKDSWTPKKPEKS